jgi:hypothetical protein
VLELLAGGGIKRGYNHGSSDKIGATPKDSPLTPWWLATQAIKRTFQIEIVADFLKRPLTNEQSGYKAGHLP